MGIPIGLKLNLPLNQFLGKFFLHHVHIWLEYIQMILNAITSESWFNFSRLFYVTCFAFSFSIAILSDIVSMLTFHVYCFYVYATRLYGLQVILIFINKCYVLYQNFHMHFVSQNRAICRADQNNTRQDY